MPNQLPSGMFPHGSPLVAAVRSPGRGRIWYVGSTAALAADDVGGNGGSPLRPFATLDYAIGQCTANAGDVIVVMENHAETLTAASAVNFDVAGITVVGLGVGDDRPTFNFTTAAAANFLIGAANIEISNFVLTCGIASQTTMMTINGSGDGAYIHHNEFREGTATGQAFIIMTGVADDVRIEDNYFYEPTAGNGDYAIQIAAGGAPTRLKINRNFIYGDFDLAGIGSTNAFTAASICDNRVVNLLTGQFAIEFTGASTGVIDRNFLGTDAQATALDPGSMYVGSNPWNATGDFVAQDALPQVDAPTNFIGVDDADNSVATTNVVRNADGSILERLEDIMATLAGTAGIATFPTAAAADNAVSMAEVLRYVSELQLPRIAVHTKTSVTAGTAWTTANSPVSIFTVTGDVLVQCFGVVDTAVTSTASTGTIELGIVGNTAVLIAQATAITSNLTVNSVWVDATSTVGAEALQNSGNWTLIGNGADVVLTIATNNMTAGAMDIYCRYIPLTSGASVVDAAT